MTKKKSIFLLILVSILLAALAVASFARFPVGIYDYNSFLGAISLDYDIAGGQAYTLTLAKDNTEDIEDVKDVTDVLSARMNALGYQFYEITALKDMTDGVEDYNVRIVAKASENLQSDIEAVSKYGEVVFYGGTTEDPTTMVMDEEPAIANSAYVGEYNDGTNTTHQVSLQFTDYGYETLTKAISDAGESSYYLKITLGEETLLNGQITKDAIQNKTVYLSSQTAEEATRMALQLKTGGLKYKYEISSIDDISPILGENTSLYIVIAIAAMIVVSIAFFAIKYKGYGLIAALSLITFILVEIAMLIAVPGITVSMGGVLGVVLATVLAIDGLIITIKRITEENELGKTVKAAVKTGYKRSLFPILNTNVIALAIGLMLFALTTGAIRNFAITFSIGVAVAFAATVLISRMFTALILPLLKKPEKFLNLKKVGE